MILWFSFYFFKIREKNRQTSIHSDILFNAFISLSVRFVQKSRCMAAFALQLNFKSVGLVCDKIEIAMSVLALHINARARAHTGYYLLK